MTNIYDQHDKHFANVSAFVILKGSDRVATIAFKYPKDGMGRLYAYVHWMGIEMVRGSAAGCGYDKRSAACSSAARALPETVDKPGADGPDYEAFRAALFRNDGYYWDDRLRKAGFTVYQAV